MVVVVVCVCVGGGGGGCNCGTGVSQYFETYPIFLSPIPDPEPYSHTWPLKKNKKKKNKKKKTYVFTYLIVRNVDLFIYCPLIFYTHLLLVVRQISQSVHSERNIYAYTGTSEKWGI